MPDRVDQKCRERALGWLADLPSLWRRLEIELVPGASAGERVSSSSPGSQAPASIAALTLRGTSARMAQPDWRRPEGWTPEDADLSIPEWVDGWVRAWRQRHEHHRPSLVDVRLDEAPPRRPEAPPRPTIHDEDGRLLPPDEVREVLRRYAADLAAWQAAREHIADEGGRVVLGLGASLEPAERSDDPLAEQHAHRYGRAAQAFSIGAGCGYLAAWFEHACEDEERHPDLEGFITGLRSLVGRARSALGERSDLVYLGRCPEPFYDRETDSRAPCGAHLVVDAFVDVVACKRCRSEWPKERWLFLCAQIREVFPDEAPDRRTWEAAA